MVPGTVFDQADRWQKLELVNMGPTIKRLARVLRASSRRVVPLDGAYLERVVVNLMDTPGQSEVFLDDLAISPIPEPALKASSNGRESAAHATCNCSRPLPGKRSAPAKGRVRLERGLLERRLKDGRFVSWFPTAIDAPAASARELALAGFDVLDDGGNTDPD